MANPRKEMPEMTPLETRIWEMMTENTGCHILDSGGAYGRAWQRSRQIEDPRKIPTISVEVWKDEVNVTYNLFPFLVNFLEMTEESEELQREFMEFSHSDEMEDESWYTCIERFIERLRDGGKLQKSYGDNTYNHDTLLGGVIQYDILRLVDCDHDFIILQTHNGCDVRGGYSDPYIFDAGDADYFRIAMTDLSCQCKKCGMSWYSDDAGYHWYYGDEFRWRTCPDANKVYHKNCGGEIEFFVMEGY